MKSWFDDYVSVSSDCIFKDKSVYSVVVKEFNYL